MRVRLIGGIREVNHKDPLLGLWLEPVVFPMAVTNYDATDPSDFDELVLHSEGELTAWAEDAFDEVGYEIFDIELPAGTEAAARPRRKRPLLHLMKHSMVARIALRLARP